MHSEKSLIFRISLAAGIALLCCSALYAIDTREEAPNFRAETIEGEAFSNESVKGKVVLVQFWTTWCPYCRREQPAVDTLGQEFADKGLVVLAVNVGEPKRKVKEYLQDSPRAVKVVLMTDTNLAALYAAKTYPYYVLIDRNGKVAGKQEGAAGESALRRLLSQAGLKSD